MQLWPFARKEKATTPHVHTKSASFVFGVGALNVMQNRYTAHAVEGYGLNPVVRACVDKIADAITSVDLSAYKKNKEGEYELVKLHPMLDLITKPNPAMSCDDFLGAFVRYYLIAGKAFIQGIGYDAMQSRPKPPSELHLLRPDLVKIEMGDKGLPSFYEYRNANYTKRFPVNQITGLSELLYKKTFNPTDAWEGLSPMTASAYGVDIQNYGAMWNLRLLQNEGRPSGALTVNGSDGSTQTLTEEQYYRLKEQIEQQFTGAANAGRPLLLEGGLQWQEMSMNAKDMDHQENINNAKRDIALAYGVPPMLLGIPGDATYSNMAEARLALWTDTVIPLLRSVLGSINSWLAPCYNDGVELWYDEDTIPALEPLRKMKADRVEASTTMTINEKRAAMGIEPQDGGDVLLVDANKIPLELVGDMGLSEVTTSQ